MDKKAGYAQPLIDFYATVIIILILIIFFTLLSFRSDRMDVTIRGDIATIDGNIILRNYLMSQVEYHDENMSIAEMLDRIDPLLTPTYEGTLKMTTFDFLRPFEEESGCPVDIYITIDDDKISILSSYKTSHPCDKYKHYYKTEQLLPSMTGKTIIVSLDGGVR